VELCGRLEFEAASTRGLAMATGVNLAALNYHFGSSGGRYVAVAEHLDSEDTSMAVARDA
jgi:AcrR family transcriptional regulator